MPACAPLAPTRADSASATRVADLRRAATLDSSPNNANDVSNGLVAEVAAERPWAHLVDCWTTYQERCPDGLVSYEVMMDACHLHPGARYVLMGDFAEVIRSLPLR